GIGIVFQRQGVAAGVDGESVASKGDVGAGGLANTKAAGGAAGNESGIKVETGIVGAADIHNKTVSAALQTAAVVSKHYTGISCGKPAEIRLVEVHTAAGVEQLHIPCLAIGKCKVAVAIERQATAEIHPLYGYTAAAKSDIAGKIGAARGADRGHQTGR